MVEYGFPVDLDQDHAATTFIGGIAGDRPALQVEYAIHDIHAPAPAKAAVNGYFFLIVVLAIVAAGDTAAAGFAGILYGQRAFDGDDLTIDPALLQRAVNGEAVQIDGYRVTLRHHQRLLKRHGRDVAFQPDRVSALLIRRGIDGLLQQIPRGGPVSHEPVIGNGGLPLVVQGIGNLQRFAGVIVPEPSGYLHRSGITAGSDTDGFLRGVVVIQGKGFALDAHAGRCGSTHFAAADVNRAAFDARSAVAAADGSDRASINADLAARRIIAADARAIVRTGHVRAVRRSREERTGTIDGCRVARLQRAGPYGQRFARAHVDALFSRHCRAVAKHQVDVRTEVQALILQCQV